MKKAQGISINTIIIAAIALLVLVILSVVFTGRMSIWDKQWDTEQPEPEMITLVFDYLQEEEPQYTGCPSRLLNANGDLLYSNLMGKGAIYERLDGDLGCIEYTGSTLINQCAWQVEFEYCFVEKPEDDGTTHIPLEDIPVEEEKEDDACTVSGTNKACAEIATEIVIESEPITKKREPLVLHLRFDVDEISDVGNKLFEYNDEIFNEINTADCARVVGRTMKTSLENVKNLRLKGKSYDSCFSPLPRKFRVAEDTELLEMVEIIPEDYNHIANGVYYKFDESICVSKTYEVQFMYGADCNV